MKKFVLMHFGFEPPTADIMNEWNKWFESIADRTVENIGFSGGREISKDGITDLGWDLASITGLSIITAETLEEAEEIAYYGDKVVFGEGDKVLMRWKVSENEYRVIFGDLTTENISSEQLAELEEEFAE